MTLWSIILIIAVIVIIARSNLNDILSKRSRTEVMFFGLIFIITGGIFLIDPNLTSTTYITSFGFCLVFIGFILGFIGFLKN